MTAPSPRDLPPVNAVLERPELAEFLATRGRAPVVQAVRQALEQLRSELRAGESVDPTFETIARSVANVLGQERRSLRRVINATGVLLHTGLGRAPLAVEAVEAVAEVARGYCNLEIDLESGKRSRRTLGAKALLRRLTGAEAATVVNNNAAATVIALRALAAGREVVVSRGQLIEIGGNFRLPEIFEVSGARLREVGTTNRTRLDDYERAIGPETAALLRVHPSNYRVVGFTESVGIAELAGLARRKGLATIDDIGSTALGPGLPPGVLGEPTVAEGLAAGVDLVLGSGDKLLGGPQCGLLLGSAGAIQRVEADPLMRAFRVDKMTLAALEATLLLALDPATAVARIPLWAFLTTPLETLQSRAETLADAWRENPGLRATVVADVSYLGGGSSPVGAIPTAVVRVDGPWPESCGSEIAWARRLRTGEPPVVARIHDGGVVFDLRAVDPSDYHDLRDAVRGVARGGIGP